MAKSKKQWELPKEFGEKWVKALRSGDYTQKSGALERHLHKESIYIGLGHCCLGVAIRMLEDKEKQICLIGSSYPLEVDGPLPKGFPELLSYTNTGVVEVLAALNDSVTLSKLKVFKATFPKVKFKKITEVEKTIGNVRYSFEQIADFIEANFEFV